MCAVLRFWKLLNRAVKRMWAARVYRAQRYASSQCERPLQQAHAVGDIHAEDF